MSLNIDSRHITGIYALGQWFNVRPNTVDVDAYEFINWEEDLEPDERPDAWNSQATVYQMGGYVPEPSSLEPTRGDYGPNSRKTWAIPRGGDGIRFIDADTGERVSFSLVEVRAFRERRPGDPQLSSGQVEVEWG